jgi:7-cyano-7-deazaguanine synthase
MTIVTLSSGGPDSSIMMLLLRREGYEILPLHVNYGQLSEKYEWSSCRRVATHLDLPQPKRLDVAKFGTAIPSGITNPPKGLDPYVPYRNLLLLTLAAAYAYSRNSHTLAIGFLAKSIYTDQSSSFAKAANKAIQLSHNYKMRIATPLIKLNKLDVIQLAYKFGFPLEITRSCYYGRKKPCGRCAACKDRDSAISILNRRNISPKTH